MDRNSIFKKPDNAIQTVCVGGVFMMDERFSSNRTFKVHQCKKEYERRLSDWSENFNRRRQFIDIII